MPMILDAIQSSKAPAVKRGCIELIGEMLSTYGRELHDKHAKKIQESIKQLLTGGDKDGRASARKVFYVFKERYRQMANEIENSLDAQTKKTLLEADTSKNFGSTTRLDQIDSGSVKTMNNNALANKSNTLKRPPSAKPAGANR